ncbi:Gldg family protein [Verrucomicrobia bacterium]|nr:Gldg family protein [Verrucomicrobiota bacterium]
MKKETKFSIFLNSVGGALVILLCVVVFNLISSQLKFKADLTEGNLYTLSDGSKKLLDELANERDGDSESSALEIRFYLTKGEKGVPVFVNDHGKRIEDLLDQYKDYAGSNLELKKINPRRDTDEEELAVNDGIQLLNNAFYVGMAVSYLDTTEVVPFFDPSKSPTLEYDISRAIKNVLKLKEDRQTVGVMSSLNVWGGPDPSNPMAMMNRGAPQQPAWYFIRQLQQDLNVERIEATASEIPEDVDVLMVIHPKNVSEATEYALDQFVLSGRKLIVFVDPMALKDEGNNQNPQMRIPGMGGASNLTRLFSKWGVTFEGTKVVADFNYRLTQRDPLSRGRIQPAYLALNKNALNSEEVVTRDLGTIRLPYVGSFDTSKLAIGLKATELISSSEQAKLVDGMSSQFNGAKVMDSFLTGSEDGKPVGTKKYTLALKLSGKFTTAFPDGKPNSGENDNEEDKKEIEEESTQIKETDNVNHVCLIGDTDLLSDEHFLVQQRFIISENIAFIQNLVDHFGDGTLINIRSRNQNRPFTTIMDLERDAQAKFEGKLKKLEAEQQAILQEKTKMESTGEGSNQFTLSIDPEALKDIQKKELEKRKQIREIRKELRAEIDMIQLWIKLANIGIMPIIVIILGIIFFVSKRKKTAAI